MKVDFRKGKELKNQGLTYKEIAKILGCSVDGIKHHLCPNSKSSRSTYQSKKARQDPLWRKRYSFLRGKGKTIPFSLDELKNKIGSNPRCYFTGVVIDVNNPKTYHFDHIIPTSRGGMNSLDNLALVRSDVNFAKRNLNADEFIKMCAEVVQHRVSK
jgi:hypothetical protein